MGRFSKKEHGRWQEFVQHESEPIDDDSFNIVYDFFHLPQLAADYVLALLIWLYRRIVGLVRLMGKSVNARRFVK